jgi:hypothetical protein
MVTITCDVCRRHKPQPEERAQEDWLLGYDLQVETPISVSRSVRFLDRWDSRRAIELGAIHLCSERCRQEYVKGAKAA